MHSFHRPPTIIDTPVCQNVFLEAIKPQHCTITNTCEQTKAINEFVVGQVASGLPPIKIPPFQTKIDGKTFYFTDMISHIGTTIVALPLISLLESIAVAKAFCKYFCIAFVRNHSTVSVFFGQPKERQLMQHKRC